MKNIGIRIPFLVTNLKSITISLSLSKYAPTQAFSYRFVFVCSSLSFLLSYFQIMNDSLPLLFGSCSVVGTCNVTECEKRCHCARHFDRSLKGAPPRIGSSAHETISSHKSMNRQWFWNEWFVIALKTFKKTRKLWQLESWVIVQCCFLVT